jgi:hypothetical protein
MVVRKNSSYSLGIAVWRGHINDQPKIQKPDF